MCINSKAIITAALFFAVFALIFCTNALSEEPATPFRTFDGSWTISEPASLVGKKLYIADYRGIKIGNNFQITDSDLITVLATGKMERRDLSPRMLGSYRVSEGGDDLADVIGRRGRARFFCYPSSANDLIVAFTRLDVEGGAAVGIRATLDGLDRSERVARLALKIKPRDDASAIGKPGRFSSFVLNLTGLGPRVVAPSVAELRMAIPIAVTDIEIVKSQRLRNCSVKTYSGNTSFIYAVCTIVGIIPGNQEAEMAVRILVPSNYTLPTLSVFGDLNLIAETPTLLRPKAIPVSYQSQIR